MHIAMTNDFHKYKTEAKTSEKRVLRNYHAIITLFLLFAYCNKEKKKTILDLRIKSFLYDTVVFIDVVIKLK